MSKLKFRTKKVFHQTSNVLSSPVNNLKTEKLSLLKSRPLTPSKTSKPRSKIKKVSHQISNVSFSPVNSLKMDVHFLTTTSKRNLPFISFSVFVVVCKSS